MRQLQGGGIKDWFEEQNLAAQAHRTEGQAPRLEGCDLISKLCDLRSPFTFLRVKLLIYVRLLSIDRVGKGYS